MKKIFIIFILLTTLNTFCGPCVYQCKLQKAPDGRDCYYCVPGKILEGPCHADCNICWGYECGGGPRISQNQIINEIFVPDFEILQKEIGLVFTTVIKSIVNGYNNPIMEKREFLKGAGKVLDMDQKERDFEFEIRQEDITQRWKIIVNNYGICDLNIGMVDNILEFEYKISSFNGENKSNKIYLEENTGENLKEYKIYFK